MRRLIFPLILGIGGVAILVALGLWQVRRLEWKEAVIAEIEARIADAPVPLATFAAPDPAGDRFVPVTLSGRTTGQEIHLLTGMTGQGPGYSIIAAFETTEGRRVLLDRGFVPESARDVPRPPVVLQVTGNLHWPDEADAYTPPPDPARNIWFARDVAAMAESLGTDPILVVLRGAEGDRQNILPVPVDSSGIPNNHRQYAITWFSLAGIWAGMTAYLLWRIRQKTI